MGLPVRHHLITIVCLPSLFKNQRSAPFLCLSPSLCYSSPSTFHHTSSSSTRCNVIRSSDEDAWEWGSKEVIKRALESGRYAKKQCHGCIEDGRSRSMVTCKIQASGRRKEAPGRRKETMSSKRYSSGCYFLPSFVSFQVQRNSFFWQWSWLSGDPTRKRSVNQE